MKQSGREGLSRASAPAMMRVGSMVARCCLTYSPHVLGGRASVSSQDLHALLPAAWLCRRMLSHHTPSQSVYRSYGVAGRTPDMYLGSY